jgi:hypothetical protein
MSIAPRAAFLLKLQAAQNRRSIAEMNCPHWDLEGGGEGGECCLELHAAEDQVQQARAALRAKEGFDQVMDQAEVSHKAELERILWELS